jgi:hypothetical protein
MDYELADEADENSDAVETCHDCEYWEEMMAINESGIG